MKRDEILSYIGVLTGSLLIAISLTIFLIPNKLAAGGVSGLSTVLHYVFNFPVGILMLCFNIPLLIIGTRVLGIGFGSKTIVGTIFLSLSVDFLAPILPVATHNLMLASIFGGVLSGIGSGLVFRFRGSTGGTDIVAKLLNKYIHLSLGQSLLLVDAVITLLAGVVFNIERALYGILAIFVTSKAIDLIQEGISYTKAALIISEKPEQIAQSILKEMDRGVTYLSGKGGYTGKGREVLLSVVTREEVSELKRLVYCNDQAAFMIVADVHEVFGEGFKKSKFD